LQELARVAEEDGRGGAASRGGAALEESALGLGRKIAEAEAEMDAARITQQNALAQVERVEGR
jgi:hypothetical protein